MLIEGCAILIPFPTHYLYLHEEKGELYRFMTLIIIIVTAVLVPLTCTIPLFYCTGPHYAVYVPLKLYRSSEA